MCGMGGGWSGGLGGCCSSFRVTRGALACSTPRMVDEMVVRAMSVWQRVGWDMG